MSEPRTSFPKPKYRSPEWFETRRTINGGTVFGASECPALMGASAFDTLQDLVVKKINPPIDRDENDATRRGHILEPALIDHCRHEYNADVVVPEVMFRRGRLVSTLDGVEFVDGQPRRVFEAKTTTAYALTDPLPQSYFWQGQAQLETTGADYVVFVCLDKYMRIGFWELHPDLQAIEELQAQAERIGSKIDRNEFVTDKDIPFTAQQIEALFPTPVGEVELDSAIFHAIEIYQAVREQATDLKRQEQEIKDQIANLLRDAEYGTVNGERVISYKRQTRKGGIDLDRMLAENPAIAEIAKQYIKQDTQFRVMRIINGR